MCLLTRVVVLLVIHLLRSHGNEVKQSPSIDRWPLILFEQDLLDLITALLKFSCSLSTTVAAQCRFQSSP